MEISEDLKIEYAGSLGRHRELIERIASLTAENTSLCDLVEREENEKSLLRDMLRAELADEEQEHVRTIIQRDAAEEALANAYAAVTGHEAVWTNLFGYDDALNEIAQTVAVRSMEKPQD